MTAPDAVLDPATADATRFLTIPRAYGPLPGPGGALVFASDMAGVGQTFRLDGPDRFPVRLAPSQSRTLPVAHTPHGLLVRIDEGGNEVWQLGLIDAGGRLRRVTRDARAIHRSVTVTPDGHAAGLAYNPEGGADWALAELDLATGEMRERVRRGGNWSWAAWGPGGVAAVTENFGARRNRAHVLRPDGGLTPLLPEARFVGGALWAGNRLFALTNLESEFVGLAEVDAADPRRLVRWLVREEGHDVRAAVPDAAGGRALLVVNEGPYDGLRVVDLSSGAATPVRSLPPGVLYADNATEAAEQVAWSEDGARLLVAWESPTLPAEVLEVAASGDGEAVAWTRAGGERPDGLVAPEEVRIPTLSCRPSTTASTGRLDPRWSCSTAGRPGSPGGASTPSSRCGWRPDSTCWRPTSVDRPATASATRRWTTASCAGTRCGTGARAGGGSRLRGWPPG
jgi:hypothetical protein